MTPARHAAPAISAHRGGVELAAGGSIEAYRGALAAGAEYAEFDVRRTCDGTLVAFHGAWVGWGRVVSRTSYGRLCELAGHEVLRMTDLLSLLAGRAVGHLDLKEPASAAVVVAEAVEVVGPAGLVVTTGDAAVAAALKHRFPAVPVGVAIGGDAAQALRFAGRRVRSRAVSRLDSVEAGRADWAVVHHRLARTGILARCRARGIKTMVWTVNSDKALASWLANQDVDVLVTDRPVRALALRDQHRP